MSEEPDEKEAPEEEPEGAKPAPAARRARAKKAAVIEVTGPATEVETTEPASAQPAARTRVQRRRRAAESAATEPVAAPAGVTLAQEKAARRALTGGATLAVLGILLVGIGPSDAGTALSLGGLIALIYGIHTYGRLGPEPAK